MATIETRMKRICALPRIAKVAVSMSSTGSLYAYAYPTTERAQEILRAAWAEEGKTSIALNELATEVERMMNVPVFVGRGKTIDECLTSIEAEIRKQNEGAKKNVDA